MALRFLIQFNCVSEQASLNLLLAEQNQVVSYWLQPKMIVRLIILRKTTVLPSQLLLNTDQRLLEAIKEDKVL